MRLNSFITKNVKLKIFFLHVLEKILQNSNICLQNEYLSIVYLLNFHLLWTLFIVMRYIKYFKRESEDLCT